MKTDKVELMTFENFEVTSQNRGNFNVCKMLSTDRDAFRLVLICGPSHERTFLKYCLLNAWGEDVVCCNVMSSDIVEDMVWSIRNHKDFDPCHYTTPEVLLVDEIQFVEGSFTQTAFLSIIKKRLEERKLTILWSEWPLEHLKMIMVDELVNFLKLGIKEEASE